MVMDSEGGRTGEHDDIKKSVKTESRKQTSFLSHIEGW